MAKEKPIITEEKLNELEKQTKDNFTKILINKLRENLHSEKDRLYNAIDFERIIGLIEHENKRNKLKEFNKKIYKNVAYRLAISSRGKKINLTLNGKFLLSKISDMIQKEFGLEPMHLYQFEVGDYKFGSECDEWQEIFDSLDNFKLGSAISASGMNKGGKFKFLYDFGENILFNIEILDIEKLIR